MLIETKFLIEDFYGLLSINNLVVHLFAIVLYIFLAKAWIFCEPCDVICFKWFPFLEW